MLPLLHRRPKVNLESPHAPRLPRRIQVDLSNRICVHPRFSSVILADQIISTLGDDDTIDDEVRDVDALGSPLPSQTLSESTEAKLSRCEGGEIGATFDGCCCSREQYIAQRRCWVVGRREVRG